MKLIRKNITIEPIIEKSVIFMGAPKILWWNVIQVADDVEIVKVGDVVRLTQNPIKYNDIYFSNENKVLIIQD